MAKRGRKAKVEDFAEDLGRLLGSTQAKAQGWMSQRQAIAKRLAEIRDMASELLADLGHGAARGFRRGQRAQTGMSTPVRAKRYLSAKARKAISDAQKRRWAAVRAAKRANQKS
jgi:hypothetical protein